MILTLDSRPQLWATHEFGRVSLVQNNTTNFKTKPEFTRKRILGTLARARQGTARALRDRQEVGQECPNLR